MRPPTDDVLLDLFRTSPVPMFACDHNRVHYANNALAQLLGRADPAELDGLDPIDDMVVPEDRPSCRAALSSLLGGEAESPPHCWRLLGAGGNPLPVHAIGQGYDASDGRRALITMVPDTSHHVAAQVREAPHDRERIAALRQVYHGVKNALQIATDILTLQASSLEDHNVVHALERAATRVRALGAVYDAEPVPHDVSRIEIRPLLHAVADGLQFAAGATGGGVVIIVDAQEASAPSREASALALIAGELISNVLTHARATECTVRYAESGDAVLLEVTDNGTDEVEPVEMEARRGLGLELVSLLAEEQLGGNFSLERMDGVTRASVRFTRQP